MVSQAWCQEQMDGVEWQQEHGGAKGQALRLLNQNKQVRFDAFASSLARYLLWFGAARYRKLSKPGAQEPNRSPSVRESLALPPSAAPKVVLPFPDNVEVYPSLW
jgi:hypothetical protein